MAQDSFADGACQCFAYFIMFPEPQVTSRAAGMAFSADKNDACSCADDLKADRALREI